MNNFHIERASRIPAGPDYWRQILQIVDVFSFGIDDYYQFWRFVMRKLAGEVDIDVPMLKRLVAIYYHWNQSQVSPSLRAWHWKRFLFIVFNENVSDITTIAIRERMSHFAFSRKDVDFMKVLVKYDFYTLSNSIYKNDFESAVDSFDDLLLELRTGSCDNLKLVISSLYHRRGRMRLPYRRGIRRIAQILTVLKTMPLRHLQTTLLQDYKTCVTLYFRISPEPYVTLEEVEDFVRFARNTILSRSGVEIFTLDDVEEIVRQYGLLFKPHCELPYQPRTLEHLSCVAVRKAFNLDKGVFPRMVKQERIPEESKLLLLGEASWFY